MLPKTWRRKDRGGRRRSVRRKAAIGLLALAAIATAPATAQKTPSGPPYEALELLKQERFKDAAKTCARAENLSVEDGHLCHLVTAIAMNRLKRFPSARSAAGELVDAGPGPALEAAGHRELGLAIVGGLKKLNRRWPRVKASAKSLQGLKDAESSLRRSLELMPDQPGTRIALADVLTGL
ncbi:MAG: hypothetical protein AAGF23_24115, partial [Acidobacteriota bacterium]